MTLPYPDSPVVTENIATSISRIKDNLAYLDTLGLTGVGGSKIVVSAACNLSLKTGVQDIVGLGFQPKAMMIFATHTGKNTYSYGAATFHSTTASADCACVFQIESYGGYASSVHVAQLQNSDVPTRFIAASVCTFLSTGVRLNWTNYNSATGSVGNIMYMFFG
jgi:hypothetical protein